MVQIPTWLWFTGCTGFAYVLTSGLIFQRVRRLYPPLLCCPMCSGFWIGAIAALLCAAWGVVPVWPALAVKSLLFGFTVSMAATAVVIVLTTIGSHRNPDAFPHDPKEPCAHSPKKTG